MYVLILLAEFQYMEERTMAAVYSAIASIPGSPSPVSAHNMTFDPVEIAESKIILLLLHVLVEEGEPGNEASLLLVISQLLTSNSCYHCMRFT